jgi:two-component system phosphate regulon sensor histidine kinase PhoR
MSIALLGIISLQVYWIGKAVKLSDQNFEQNVNDALHQVVAQLEQEDLNRYVIFATTGMQVNWHNGQAIIQKSKDTIHIQRQQGRESLIVKQQYNPERLQIQMHAEMGARDSARWVRRILKQQADTAEFLEKELSRYRYWAEELTGGTGVMEEMFTRSMQFMVSPQRSVKDRIDPELLDTLLRRALADHGIRLDYQYLVTHPLDGRIVYASEQASEETLRQAHHRVRLFPNSLMARSFLSVHFPHQRMYALGEVWGVALASLLFTGVILLCFWLAVRTIFRQKKLSEMKGDFINNMTHEFKTPLATISLATDALRSPLVRQDPEKMDRYAHIIKEENKRMNQQVERVLQIARSEIKLKPVRLNLHEIIQKATRNIQLHVEQRAGSLHLALDAPHPVMQADEVHLSNLISNLLDNANKYSPERPQITLSSWEEEDFLVFSVSDRGQGISKADQEKIFDRFYRVSTGNLHDVKGFGLGLSYVKEIVEAHGGSISVKSKLGEGSTFIVRMPKRGPYS